MTHPGVRASDEDRHRVVGELERHTAVGRLTLDEFSDRVARAYQAATHADLSAITHDLPTAPPADPSPPASSEQRHLLIALLMSALTIAVLGVAIALWK